VAGCISADGVLRADECFPRVRCRVTRRHSLPIDLASMRRRADGISSAPSRWPVRWASVWRMLSRLEGGPFDWPISISGAPRGTDTIRPACALNAALYARRLRWTTFLHDPMFHFRPQTRVSRASPKSGHVTRSWMRYALNVVLFNCGRRTRSGTPYDRTTPLHSSP
jgi:hypothetical protein